MTGERIGVLPCTRDEFLVLSNDDAKVIEAAVYIEGEGTPDGPYVLGWSSVGDETTKEGSLLVVFDGEEEVTKLVIGEDGAYLVEEVREDDGKEGGPNEEG